jgi:hypothetical protein
MVVILDTGRHWRTQFWKGTIQGSFQHSLVEIGSVVSKEKIFELYKHNDELFNIYYGIFYELWTFAYFDRLCELEKRGDESKKNILLWNYRANVNQTLLKWFLGGPLPKLCPHIFGRKPSTDYLIKILFLLSKWFQTRRFIWEFPIGSYVKLSSAVAAILVGVLKCRTKFWKRTRMKFKKNLLLWNYSANLNQTSLKWSLGGPLSKLCPSAPSCIQDGHHY